MDHGCHLSCSFVKLTLANFEVNLPVNYSQLGLINYYSYIKQVFSIKNVCIISIGHALIRRTVLSSGTLYNGRARKKKNSGVVDWNYHIYIIIS
jgi:hypothetical protein